MKKGAARQGRPSFCGRGALLVVLPVEEARNIDRLALEAWLRLFLIELCLGRAASCG